MLSFVFLWRGADLHGLTDHQQSRGFGGQTACWGGVGKDGQINSRSTRFTANCQHEDVFFDGRRIWVDLELCFAAVSGGEAVGETLGEPKRCDAETGVEVEGRDIETTAGLGLKA